MSCQCVLPTEIIHGILCYADPRDIIFWRTVSKWFHAITSDATLWRALYANAPFPCPPGPSPSQSITSLERTLIRSVRLAESWTTRPLREVSSVRILNTEPSNGFQTSQIIRGRWLVVLEANKRLVLHDIDAIAASGPGMHRLRRVLWEREVWSVLIRMMFSWIPPVEGQWILYVLVGSSNSPSDWKMLEFWLDDESGELYDSVTIERPTVTDNPDDSRLANQTTILQQHKNFGNSPFFFIPLWRLGVVFDGRTHVFSKLPPFRFALDQTRIYYRILVGELPTQTQMVFTDTHSIVFHHFFSQRLTVVQIFELSLNDPSGEKGKLAFRLTHEGTVHGPIINPLILKFSVDPITETTAVVVLAHYSSHTPRQKLVRVDFTLLKSSPAGVLPLTIDVGELQLPPDTQRWLSYVDIFDDGRARGFSAETHPIFADFLKFTIDTTQNPWAIACGRIAPSRWSCHRKDMVSKLSGFDGMRGRLCYTEADGSIVIFDVE